MTLIFCLFDWFWRSFIKETRAFKVFDLKKGEKMAKEIPLRHCKNRYILKKMQDFLKSGHFEV